MHRRDIHKALEAYAQHHMPNDRDLWPQIRQKLPYPQGLASTSSALRRGAGMLTGAIGCALILLLLIMITNQLARRAGKEAALHAPAGATAAAAGIGAPPVALSPDEAADVACFAGQATAQGDRAYVGHQRQILVAELTQRTAEQFLTAQNVAAPRSPVALDPNTPLYFVIVRGTVTDRLGGAERTLGGALAVIVDRQNHTTYADINERWNSLAPATARDVAPRLVPRLNNVSVARAQGALGATVVGPSSVPVGLTLQGVNINRSNTQVDPSGAYSSTPNSVTSVYSDTAAEPQLWLSQATVPFELGANRTARSLPVGSTTGHYSVREQGASSIATLVWQDGDRWFCLTARLSAAITEQDLLGTAVAVPHLTAMPSP